MEGTIRYLYDAETDPQAQPLQRFERLVKNICDAHQAEFDIELIYSHPAVINDPIVAEFLSAIAENILVAKENIVPFIFCLPA